MYCHACASEVPVATGERIGFSETCPTCHADLHVCLNCAHHDRSAYNECRESNAERVADRDRANRCEYFRAKEGPPPEGGRTLDERDQAMNALESLFKKQR